MRNPLSGSELAILAAEGMRSQQAGRKLYASLGKPTVEHISDPEWVREYDAALRLFGRGESLLNYFQQFKKRRIDELQNPFSAAEIARLRKYKSIGEGGLRKSREYEDLAKDDLSTWWQWHVTRIQTEASTTAIQWMIDTFAVTAKPPLPGSKFYGEQMASPERERDDPNYWSQYNNPGRRRANPETLRVGDEVRAWLGVNRWFGEITAIEEHDGKKVALVRTHPGGGFWIPVENITVVDPAPGLPGFYSHLERVVKEKFPEKFTAEQALGILKGAGVKDEEIRWTRFGWWLKDWGKGGTITKAEASEYLGKSHPVLKESVRERRSTGVASLRWSEHDQHARTVAGYNVVGKHWVAMDRNDHIAGAVHLTTDGRYLPITIGSGAPLTLYSTLDEAKTHIGEWHESEPSEKPTRYGGYSLPGGRKYGEYVLRYERPLRIPGDDQVARRMFGKDYEKLDLNERDKVRREIAAIEQVVRNVPTKFHPPHFAPDENILGHARYNTFKDAEGKDVFFIEEIQSDWHQTGREHGYAPSEEEALVARRDAVRKAKDAYDEHQRLLGVLVSEGKTIKARMQVLVKERDKQYPPVVIKSEDGRVLYAGDDDREGEITRHENRGSYRDWDAIHPLPQEWQDLNRKYGGMLTTAQDAHVAYLNADQEMRKGEQTVSTKTPAAPFAETTDWAGLFFRRMLAMAADRGYDRIGWTPGIVQTRRWSDEVRKEVDIINWVKMANGRVMIRASKGGKLVFNHQVPIDTEYMLGGHKVSLDTLLGKKMATEIRTSSAKRGTFTGEGLAISGEGMKWFYDTLLPQIANKLGKKYGVSARIVPLVVAEGEPLPVHTMDIPATMRQDIKEKGFALFNPVHALAKFAPGKYPNEFSSTHTLDAPWFPRNPVVARPGEPFVWNYSSPPPNADVQHRAMTLPPKPRKGRPGFFGKLWHWLNT